MADDAHHFATPEKADTACRFSGSGGTPCENKATLHMLVRYGSYGSPDGWGKSGPSCCDCARHFTLLVGNSQSRVSIVQVTPLLG